MITWGHGCAFVVVPAEKGIHQGRTPMDCLLQKHDQDGPMHRQVMGHEWEHQLLHSITHRTGCTATHQLVAHISVVARTSSHTAKWIHAIHLVGTPMVISVSTCACKGVVAEPGRLVYGSQWKWHHCPTYVWLPFNILWSA